MLLDVFFFFFFFFLALMGNSRRTRVKWVSERLTYLFWNFKLSSHRLSRLLIFSPTLTFWILTSTFDFLNFWLSLLSWLSIFDFVFDFWLSRLSWLLIFDFDFNFWLSRLLSHRHHRSFRAYENFFFFFFFTDRWNEPLLALGVRVDHVWSRKCLYFPRPRLLRVKEMKKKIHIE